MQKLKYVVSKSIIFVSLIALTSCGNNNVFLFQADNSYDKGWMAGGYGELLFTYINALDESVHLSHLTGDWYVGDQMLNSWDWNLDIDVAAGDTFVYNLIAWMPNEVAAYSERANDDPIIRGNSYAVFSGDTIEEFYTLRIPVAGIGDLVRKEGENIAVELKEESWRIMDEEDRFLNMLDEVYLAMVDLTGQRPYDGEYITFREAPQHPYFAYAGQEIIFNEKFVPASLEKMNKNELDFGWIHELGHDFDNGIGEWYNFGTFTEFMANIKLSYVIEMLVNDDHMYKFKSWVQENQFVDGKTFNLEYFIPYGEKYERSERNWDEMSSDEYHAMIYTIIDNEGWDPLKRTFRKYVELNKTATMKPPSTEEKIQLFLSVLQQESKMDCMPLYEKYKLPVNNNVVEECLLHYFGTGV